MHHPENVVHNEHNVGGENNRYTDMMSTSKGETSNAGAQPASPTLQPRFLAIEKGGATTANVDVKAAPAIKVRPAEEVAAKLGVAPTAPASSPRQRKRASFWFGKWLTVSQILDPIRIPNSHVNYQCVWWKALSGNDVSSAVQDGGLAYDLLPPLTRLAVASPFASKYPRFHHANVELRTKYLNNAMFDQIIPEQLDQKQQQQLDQKKIRKRIRVVLMGGGYDLRLLRVAEHFYSSDKDEYQDAAEALDLVELDLPQVILAKQELLQKRFLRRRPEFADAVNRIRMFGVDLNKVDQVESVVTTMLKGKDEDESGKANNIEDDSWFTIFVFEAVMIYLDDQVPSRLLSILSQALKKRGESGAVCFADTLGNVDSGKEDSARMELEQCGWDLQDWLPKPGRTQHLGWASLALN